jgi:hypothetical protein
MKKSSTPKPPQPLRDYTSHPMTELFPRMTPAEYQSFKEDIAVSGQRLPIYVIGKQVIDGRHRLQACQELGLEPKIEDVSDDPFRLLKSLNLERRHLTGQQRAAILRMWRDQYSGIDREFKRMAEEARERQLAALKQGPSHPRRSQVKPTGTPPKGRTRDLIAKTINASASDVSRVDEVHRKHPDQVKAIAQGKTTATRVLSGTRSTKRATAKVRSVNFQTLRSRITRSLDEAWMTLTREDQAQVVALLVQLFEKYRAQLSRKTVDAHIAQTLTAVVGDAMKTPSPTKGA